MAIPATHIVNVAPRVISGGSNDLDLNGLLLSDNPLISASTMVLSFPSASAVGAYFGVDSVEYAAAGVYFTSYNNKFSAPKAFLVAKRVAEAVPAWLRGGKITQTVAQLKAASACSMGISIDNTTYTVSGVDFSSAQSYSDVAALLATKLSAAASSGVAVDYSSLTGAFTITSGTAGSVSEVSYASATGTGTDLSALLNLTQASGATLSQGMDALSVNDQMTAIRVQTENWVSFTTAWETDADETLEWAAWANANYGWLYVAYSTSDMVTSVDSTADLASILQNSGNDHTTAVYGSLEYACFIMGVVASVAWQRVDGTITAAFKQQSGLSAWVADEMTAATLEGKNCNYFGKFATRNAEFIFLYPGCLSASDYGYIDPYVNSIWLNNRLQIALMDGITSVGRAPYNQRGYTMIAAWMMDPINDARNNGVIESGVTLSESQRSEVMNEAGLDISNELWTQGYYLQILDPGAAVRAKRESPVISLWYTYGGAVQRITVASTAIL